MNKGSEIYNSYISRGVNLERFEAILKFAGQSILDVGCGSGAYVLKLADQYQIRGIDNQKYTSWENMPYLFSISDAADLSNYTENSIDTILTFETLEHLDDPHTALHEYYRVCRKNIILSVPNCKLSKGMEESKLVYYHWIDKSHINFFDMESIQELVIKSGFKIVHSRYINQISLYPLLKETFNFKFSNEGIVRKMFDYFARKKYYLTCLVIGEKS